MYFPGLYSVVVRCFNQIKPAAGLFCQIAYLCGPMKGRASLPVLNRRLALAVGVLAAFMVICTSAFQFHLEPVAYSAEVKTQQTTSPEGKKAPEGATDEQGRSQNICTIQAVSQGVQLHVTYEPLVWEFFSVELPELKAEVPRKVYATSWEYFKVLFRDIISPNAP